MRLSSGVAKTEWRDGRLWHAGDTVGRLLAWTWRTDAHLCMKAFAHFHGTLQECVSETIALGALWSGVATALTVSLARAMQWLISSNRDPGRKVDRGTVASSGKGTTAALTAGRRLVACGAYEFPSTELRYRAGTPMPTRPAHDNNGATELAATIPALMWPAWALRLAPPHLDFQHMSARLAGSILLVNSRVSFDEAIGLLGRPLNNQALSHVLRRLRSDPCWDDIRRAVIVVADTCTPTTARSTISAAAPSITPPSYRGPPGETSAPPPGSSAPTPRCTSLRVTSTRC